jgi:hypothetical protein
MPLSLMDHLDFPELDRLPAVPELPHRGLLQTANFAGSRPFSGNVLGEDFAPVTRLEEQVTIARDLRTELCRSLDTNTEILNRYFTARHPKAR